MTNVTPRAPQGKWRPKRVFAWLLAAAALGFIAYAVPLRDRCEDPAAHVAQGERVPRVRVSRDGGDCVLHRAAGDARLSAAECAELRCEPGLVSALAGARPWMLAILFGVYLFTTFVTAVRWRVLLALAKVHLGILETWRIALESLAGGVVLPGGIGGDALRVAFVVGRGASLSTVVAAVLLDRVIGLVTLAGLASALAAIYGGGELGPVVVVLGSIPVAFLAGVALARWAPILRAPFLVRGPLARVARPALEYIGSPHAPRAILGGLAVSAVASATYLGAVRCIVAALGATPDPERWVYTGTAMAGIVGAIPLLPGGWGTSDAAFVFFLGKAGLAPSTALAVGLVGRFLGYCTAAVGALLYVLRQHNPAAPSGGGDA